MTTPFARTTRWRLSKVPLMALLMALLIAAAILGPVHERTAAAEESLALITTEFETQNRNEYKGGQVRLKAVMK